MRAKHPAAQKTLKLKNGCLFQLHDWWMNVAGMSWKQGVGIYECIQYAIRAGLSQLPDNDEVVYGRMGEFLCLVHVSELEEGGH